MRVLALFVSTFTVGVALLVGGATEAQASSNSGFWGVIGSGCIIDTGSTSIGIVDAYSSNITFSGTNTGTIHVTCPVSGFQVVAGGGDNPSLLGVTFIDTDGTTDNCTINAYLYRYNSGATPAITEVAHYNGGTDATMAGTSPFSNLESVSFTHTFDFDNNYYFVYVDLFRNTSTCNVKFVGAKLFAPL